MSEELFDELYEMAEDVIRLDPWSRQVAPFVLRADDEAYLVVFEKDGERDAVRFLCGISGLRGYLYDDAADNRYRAEAYVRQFDGHYLEMQSGVTALSSYERKLLNERERRIVFRAQTPGALPTSIVVERPRLLQLLKAVRTLLLRSLETPLARARVHDKMVFAAPAYRLDDGQVVEDGDWTVKQAALLAADPAQVDAFTAARLLRLPSDEQVYELFFFYLPIATDETGPAVYPMTFFLVNLDSGLIEWSEVVLPRPEWPKRLLRGLWRYFIEENVRPARIFTYHTRLFCALAQDCRAAGVAFEKIGHSYVGEELLAAYLKMAHIREKRFLEERVPQDPAE